MSTTAIKERPILMSAPMTRAILGGTKSMTRRVVKPQPPSNMHRHCWFDAPVYGWTYEPEPAAEWHRVACPYGKPGDRLWVRESFGYLPGSSPEDLAILYRADEATRRPPSGWRPSIFMHRRESRITLEITEVRVERLQDISEADKLAEGATPEVPFGTVWRKINTKPGIRWEDNPFCWAISFRRLEGS